MEREGSEDYQFGCVDRDYGRVKFFARAIGL